MRSDRTDATDTHEKTAGLGLQALTPVEDRQASDRSDACTKVHSKILYKPSPIGVFPRNKIHKVCLIVDLVVPSGAVICSVV